MNVDLNECCFVSKLVNEFAEDNGLIRCDKLFPGAYVTTYYNESLICHSNIDFILPSKADSVNYYNVLDPFVNFSDHRPVFVNCVCHISQLSCDDARNASYGANVSEISYLRWDHADLDSYRELCRVYLLSILQDLYIAKN